MCCRQQDKGRSSAHLCSAVFIAGEHTVCIFLLSFSSPCTFKAKAFTPHFYPDTTLCDAMQCAAERPLIWLAIWLELPIAR